MWIPSGRLSIQDLQRISPACRVAWHTGQICTDGQSIAEVVREFNLYNHTKIVIVDPEIGKVRIGGLFEATDPDSFARAVSALTRVHVMVQSTPSGREIRLESEKRAK